MNEQFIQSCKNILGRINNYSSQEGPVLKKSICMTRTHFTKLCLDRGALISPERASEAAIKHFESGSLNADGLSG